MMQSWIFSIITPVFSVTWFFRNLFIYLCFFIYKEQYLCEIKKHCNIINVFADTFGQFNGSLLNKILINSFFILLTTWIVYHSFHSNIMQQKHCFLALIIMINMHSKPNNNCNKKTKKLFLCNAIIFHNITALMFFWSNKMQPCWTKETSSNKYIYAFSRRFYPKRLSLYIFFVSMCVPWELNPQPFALLTQCSVTGPQEHITY